MKFNGMENHFIQTALTKYAKALEDDVIRMKSKNQRPIFASGYFTMVCKEIKQKVDKLTKS